VIDLARFFQHVSILLWTGFSCPAAQDTGLGRPCLPFDNVRQNHLVPGADGLRVLVGGPGKGQQVGAIAL